MGFDDGAVPSSPSAKLPEEPSAEITSIVTKLMKIFEERPMWTRRGLMNKLDQTTNFYNIKFALPYVSYMWKSGPWRDCYARFGVDPRSNSSYAVYQAIYCMSKVVPATSDVDPVMSSSHIFDGKTLFPKGRTFMFCDMSDPILVQIRERATKRAEPHPRDGWWKAKMILSTRNILREKLASLCAGKVPSDLEFTSILESANDTDDNNDDEKMDESLETETVAEEGRHDPDLEEDEEDDEGEEGFDDSDGQVQTLVTSLIRPGEIFNNNRDLLDKDDDVESNAELEESDN
ncbi:Transcription factor tau subunit sfc15 / FY16936)) [Taphrina deformans PYCC 5710]|uniref:Transcription factor tau subunit sfc15 / FY16936 n=1 Tax=Taphrina deformans (strain PYCC 5710 / ATCC 11124 / CBS 356.35 / IMI 108563 / JCM 9778 / NBRC 8474) TaxID=1097556 RepID=R4X8H3_TAPDE|nr:Transcription factor tau subunit sfc15 / FY16936)) [Taphrina deformans PYCC 5710]|eukprot:CCG81898.1 Transcription factor tau subunit sfc15 / FY16936)) [Taphrina deformans PYCC 5710]